MNNLNGIPKELILYKVLFHGEAYVLASSEEEAKKIYKESANYLNEVVDSVTGKAKYSQTSEQILVFIRENLESDIMEYSKFVLFFREYNGVGDSMDIDSWDDKSKEFNTEDELREYISNQPSYLFRPKAVYRLDNTILELE